MTEAAGAAGPEGVDEKPAAWFVPAGFAIGFAGALCGIGGGIFVAPLLHGLRRVPLKRAAATAIVVVLATTVASTVAEATRADSQLAWSVALPLACGALAGAQLGFAVAKRIDERHLKTLFAGVLALAGVRVLFFSSAVALVSAPGALAAGALAFAIGLAGGFLTPLLGVAGGILMVPALFLFLGQPFGVARACALAAGSVSALRSLWLHARAGNIHWALGRHLALGALFGALGGVVAAHDPVLAQGGRVGLGVVLLLQAARFLRQLHATRADADAR